jgi:hypothetical protein
MSDRWRNKAVRCLLVILAAAAIYVGCLVSMLLIAIGVGNPAAPLVPLCALILQTIPTCAALILVSIIVERPWIVILLFALVLVGYLV